MTTDSATYLTELHQRLNQHFNLAEIQTLCLQLHVDYESIPGQEKPSIIRELLLALGRRNRLPDLISLLQQERPNVTWPLVPDDLQLPDSLISGTATPASQYHIGGDMMQGDKFDGDKVGRDKIIYNIYGEPPDKPSESDAADLLPTYHQACVTQLNAPRYQLDSRFVQLTLLIDEGADAQGPRFTPDSQRQKYNSLAALLADTDDRAIVLLGKPGSGKTTLLRRLQWEHAREQLEKPTGQVAFFVPLNSYRSPAPGAPPPDPYEWLAGEWRIRQPQLPDFRTFYEAGRMLLLLDGLNEMPHKDKADYRARIARWQTFWQRTWQYGNTVVFSCRSLDYSAPLSGEAAPVRQTRVEPLTPAQIEEFLRLYLGHKSEPVWQTLRHDPQRLALFSAPFFLRLLTDQIEASGGTPAGPAALLTGFVRRALYREMDERQHRLFAPGTLLSEDDCQQIRFDEWDGLFDLPVEGRLIPGLEQLACRMQDNRSSEEAALVRVKTGEAQNWLPPETAREIMAAGFQLNVLDKDLARREITFFHQLIQEYFAARVLARQPQPEDLAVPWHTAAVNESLADTVAALEVSDPLPRLPTTGWEETALLAAPMSQDQEAFVRDLIEPNLPLAARCAAAVEVTVSLELTRRLQEELIARIN
ncbi:MAG: NACHT domain-containing protein, partial [Chloroflexi bacterium]|nr:NACHT domain-containing protein [Chloroflexota bacterium]